MAQAHNLPITDITKATQPDIFDGLDLSEFAPAQLKTITELLPADRMRLVLGLDVPPTARIVAGALAWHGWIAYPSRDYLARRLRIAPSNITRALNELEAAGIIRKAERRGDRNQRHKCYIFNSLELLKVAAAVDSPEGPAAALRRSGSPPGKRPWIPRS